MQILTTIRAAAWGGRAAATDIPRVRLALRLPQASRPSRRALRTPAMPALLAAAPVAASPLHEAVSAALHSSPYVAGSRVRIEAGDGSVRLHGDVGTFFEKQMAQEVVRRIDGVQRVENLLQVVWA